MNLGTAFVEMMAFKKVHFYFQNAYIHTYIHKIIMTTIIIINNNIHIYTYNNNNTHTYIYNKDNNHTYI